MLRYEAATDAEREAWDLIARPDAWHEWAPHVRGAWGLSGADGEIEPGRRGAARLLGALPVPVAIVDKRPGAGWTWRVAGVVDMDHRVEPGRVAVEIHAPAPVEAAIRVSYGPLIAVLLRRLSRSATARRRPTDTRTPAG